jgi:asparagine synthase (glutamine-hydrolysing)
MKIFLIWKNLKDVNNSNETSVGYRLRETFAPLFENLPATQVITFPSANLAVLDMPIKGFAAQSFQEDDQTWAYAPEYPINASAVFTELGIKTQLSFDLPALARTLEANPTKVLARLAPPFSLIWSQKLSGDIFIQTDGLGHALVYEYRDKDFWAVSNRPFAFSALGIDLYPDAEEWTARCILGWFPCMLTGFHNMRYVEPGIQIHLSDLGISYKKINILNEWLTPSTENLQSCLELAQSSIVNYVRSAKPLLNKPVVSLSGGWDSRAITSVFIAEKIKFTAKVRGPAEHPDVLIANQLARVADFEIKSKYSAGIPPHEPEKIKENILLALLWQAGGRNAHQNKSFQMDGRFIDGGSLGISGQHGEIGRSHYLATIRKASLPVDGKDSTLFQYLTRKTPNFIRPSMRDVAFDMINDAIAQADMLDLSGLKRWDFFYLYERTRRWAAGAQAGKPGFSLMPFLSPGFINASFSYPLNDMTDNPFHHYVIRNLMPAWYQIPFANEIDVKTNIATVSEKTAELPIWQKIGRRRFYDTKLYWQEVGRPFITETIATDGFWSEIFDPALILKHWNSEPDELIAICFLPVAIAKWRQR